MYVFLLQPQTKLVQTDNFVLKVTTTSPPSAIGEQPIDNEEDINKFQESCVLEKEAQAEAKRKKDHDAEVQKQDRQANRFCTS
jgi:hypothetical protein